jgi:hypothetical protein
LGRRRVAEAVLGSLLVLAAAAQAAPLEPLSTYLLDEPCRLLDTRVPQPYGFDGPLPWVYRSYRVQGYCGVPVGARAVFATVTVTQPTVEGFLTFMRAPVGEYSPDGHLKTSTINFAPGQTIANTTLLPLQTVGDLYGEETDVRVYAHVPGGTVHLVIDVIAYLR